MSLAAMLWALNDAPVDDPAKALILVAFADHAAADGTGCFPAISRVAARARVSPRTVQRHLREMLEAGLIRLGDQGLVSGLRADHRPVVYDLNLAVTWSSVTGCQSVAPTADGVSPAAPRGVTAGRHGVSQVSPEPKTQPTTQPAAPKGAAADFPQDGLFPVDNPGPGVSVGGLAVALARRVCDDFPRANALGFQPVREAVFRALSLGEFDVEHVERCLRSLMVARRPLSPQVLIIECEREAGVGGRFPSAQEARSARSRSVLADALREGAARGETIGGAAVREEWLA
jgi:DNA-binding transcriptional ArsR family regulator